MLMPRLALWQRVLMSCLVGLGIAIPLLYVFEAQSALPAQVRDVVGDATIQFNVDRSAVFGPGECVTRSWAVDGIREVYLRVEPVTGQETRQACIPTIAPYQVFELRVVFRDGSQRTYSLTTEVLSARLWGLGAVLASALVVAAVWGWRLTAASHGAMLAPFAARGGVHVGLLALFVALNGIVLLNSLRHDAIMAYDSGAHHAYVDVLSQGRLPDADETPEYFSPPLPYVFPALVKALIEPGCPRIQSDDCGALSRKAGQVQNVVLSVVTLYFLLATAEKMRPGDSLFKALALLLVGLVPVYMKSHGMLRGEVFIAAAAVWTCYQLVSLLPLTKLPSIWSMVRLGIGFGLLLLSRQWGLFVIIAALLWCLLMLYRSRLLNARAVSLGLVAVAACTIVAGWFYLSLTLRFGSPIAFNRDAAQAHGETVDWNLEPGALFTSPYGVAFRSSAIPKFYTEIWGDYEGYWFFSHRAPMPEAWIAYAGRVNLAALLPTALYGAGIGLGLYELARLFVGRKGQMTAACALCVLVVAMSLAGYGWFLTNYPSINADTVKATYMLQIFPFMALLGAETLRRLQNASPLTFAVACIVLSAAGVYILPMLFTRSTWLM